MYDFDGTDEHASLYFLEAHGWTVWIRLISRGSADASAELFDGFVREQSWERLGMPGDHGAGS
jgi:hypothetical protein